MASLLPQEVGPAVSELKNIDKEAQRLRKFAKGTGLVMPEIGGQPEIVLC